MFADTTTCPNCGDENAYHNDWRTSVPTADTSGTMS